MPFKDLEKRREYHRHKDREPKNVAMRKAWRENNKEWVSQRDKAYRLAHKAEYAIKDAARRAKNREEAKARTIAWRKANPERCRISPEVNAAKHAKRRARKTQAGGSFTAAEWFTLCFAVGFKCLRCRQVKKLTPDHVVPVSKGGSSYLYNIQPLCGECNSIKHTQTVDYRDTL